MKVAAACTYVVLAHLQVVFHSTSEGSQVICATRYLPKQVKMNSRSADILRSIKTCSADCSRECTWGLFLLTPILMFHLAYFDRRLVTDWLQWAAAKIVGRGVEFTRIVL